jgi:hypothetical protein
MEGRRRCCGHSIARTAGIYGSESRLEDLLFHCSVLIVLHHGACLCSCDMDTPFASGIVAELLLSVRCGGFHRSGFSFQTKYHTFWFSKFELWYLYIYPYNFFSSWIHSCVVICHPGGSKQVYIYKFSSTVSSTSPQFLRIFKYIISILSKTVYYLFSLPGMWVL